MKKRGLALLIGASMAIGMAGCSGGGSSQTAAPAPAQTSAAAAADTTAAAGGQEAPATEAAKDYKDMTGKVVIYTSMYEDIIEAMDNKLDEVFPNMDIEFFYGGTGTLQSKVAAEMDSGKLGCDILMVAEPSYALELKEANILHPYKFSETDKLLFDYDPDGYWYPVRMLNMVLAYNPEKYSKDSLPNSFKDFAYDPEMKGSLSMGNPLTSGTSYAAIVALLDKYGEEYYKALGDQGVAIESGSDLFQGLSMLFVHSQHKEGQHNQNHTHSRYTVSGRFSEQKEKRYANKRSAREADKLPLGQIEHDLCFDFC